MASKLLEAVLLLTDELSLDEKGLVAEYIRHEEPLSGLTLQDKKTILSSVRFNIAFQPDASLRREDWYDDDGR
jgi:hypothetical protein